MAKYKKGDVIWIPCEISDVVEMSHQTIYEFYVEGLVNFITEKKLDKMKIQHKPREKKSTCGECDNLCITNINPKGNRGSGYCVLDINKTHDYPKQCVFSYPACSYFVKRTKPMEVGI